MSFLLDTNVLSETSKSRPDPQVAAWLWSAGSQFLYTSVITIGEIEQGISRLRHRGDDLQAARLNGWLSDVVNLFEDRVVPVTSQVAREWGRLSGAGAIPAIDGLIGATARVHGWTVVTRNVKDFARLDVPVLNPFTET